MQTIGFLSHLRGKKINGPFMVVGPLSTLSNWVDEFKRWLPSINVILYHGSKDERQKLRNKHMPVGMAASHASDARTLGCAHVLLSQMPLTIKLPCVASVPAGII